MIVRERDEALIRSVTAHKAVWRGISGQDEPMDFIVPDGEWYSLVRDGSKVGFIAILQEDGFKSAHIGVLPEHRGKWVIDDFRKVLEQTVGVIKARVRHNKAYAMAVRVGFRRTGDDAEGWIDMELHR